MNNSPTRYIDPTGHDVGCSAVNPNCLDSNGMTSQAKVEMGRAVSGALKSNVLDVVPVVSDIRGVIRGSQRVNWASEQPDFQDQQADLQGWYNECYGNCHYSEHVESGPIYPNIGGPMPETPLVDIYSEGMGEAVGSAIDLGMTVAVTKISLSNTRVFSHGGADWHLGLETPSNMNIVHLGNHPGYGTHIAFGAIKPFVADLHIYLQKSFPFFRTWRPK